MRVKRLCGLIICAAMVVSLGWLPQGICEEDLSTFIQRMTIPEDMGSIEARWVGSSDTVLILIQDSHISLEVQLFIAQIIEHCIKDKDACVHCS